MDKSEQRQQVLAQRDRVATDIKELLADTEGLLRATASYTGAELDDARAKLRVRIDQARAQAHDWEGVATQKYRDAAAATETYVQQNVWKSLGLAALAGALLACCASGSGRDRE